MVNYPYPDPLELLSTQVLHETQPCYLHESVKFGFSDKFLEISIKDMCSLFINLPIFMVYLNPYRDWVGYY